MRIRKNTKLSSLLLATAGYDGERPEAYVCHLNQSPWDVIPLTSSRDGDGAAELTNLLDSSWFLPSLSFSSPPLIHQFNEDDSFNGNVSLRDSKGTAERLNSSMEKNRSLVSVERLNLIGATDDYERSPDVEEPVDQSDNSDKKSKPVEPILPVKNSGDDDQVAVEMLSPKRGWPRGTAKKAPASTAASTNPYEFYYYSGFGPRWGRTRGDSSDEMISMGDNKKNNTSKKSSRCSDDEEKTTAFEDGSSSVEGFDYMEDGNSLVDQGTDHGIKKKKERMMMTKKPMKRGRKPVKERSLKSLM